MIYCLQTEDSKMRIEIRCTLANKPNTVADLVAGVRKGTIEMVRPQSLTDRLKKFKGDAEFDTDWERTGAQAKYINWIPIENL